MPELPEVETICRDLRSQGLTGATIESVSVYWPRTIGEPDVATFESQLSGVEIRRIRRRAKFLIWETSADQFLWIHLRMTGKLVWRVKGAPRNSHEHVILRLSGNRELGFLDPRKFGRWYLISDPQRFEEKLGPEPLAESFDVDLLKAILAGRSARIKTLLLNQRMVAGIGNIYADEALWKAKIHPGTPANGLNFKQLQSLHEAIQTVLREGIRHFGSSLGDNNPNYFSVAGRRGRHQAYLKVFRRTGLPCPRCHNTIERIKVAQRSSHICPRCQKAP